MNVNFVKYQGAGNDFVIIDNRNYGLPRHDVNLYKKLCDRRFGIGADGLMLLNAHDTYDFEMVYYNADGHEGSMCGNGGRCIVAFAARLGLAEKRTAFLAVDGPHEANIMAPDVIDLKMIDVNIIDSFNEQYFMDTGSPHYVVFTDKLHEVDVYNKGKNIRYSDKYKSKGGTNVNFVEKVNNGILVRTYERGVEDETLACGTGVVASAIATVIKYQDQSNAINVKARGGNLSVRFKRGDNNLFSDIWLKGPAEFVFEGVVQASGLINQKER